MRTRSRKQDNHNLAPVTEIPVQAKFLTNVRPMANSLESLQIATKEDSLTQEQPQLETQGFNFAEIPTFAVETDKLRPRVKPKKFFQDDRSNNTANTPVQRQEREGKEDRAIQMKLEPIQRNQDSKRGNNFFLKVGKVFFGSNSLNPAMQLDGVNSEIFKKQTSLAQIHRTLQGLDEEKKQMMIKTICADFDSLIGGEYPINIGEPEFVYKEVKRLMKLMELDNNKEQASLLLKATQYQLDELKKEQKIWQRSVVTKQRKDQNLKMMQESLLSQTLNRSFQIPGVSLGKTEQEGRIGGEREDEVSLSQICAVAADGQVSLGHIFAITAATSLGILRDIGSPESEE